MIKRIATDTVKELIENFPAILFSGPRQVGKTTLARQISKSIDKPCFYLDLEKIEDYELLKNNAYSFLMSLKDHCVIIDEIQTNPQLFSILRPIIDEHRIAGRFILLGSANLNLVKGVSETLAGRIVYLDIHQINLIEAKSASFDLETHWLKGGFPEQLLSKNVLIWQTWTDSFIKSYIYRDLNFFFGIDLAPSIIDKLWYILASQNSGIENIENISRSIGVSSNTCKKYLEFLEGAFLIHRLPAFFVNNGKRLVKSPKLYLRTSGILHYMLKINTINLLQTNIAVGASWEAYVIEQIFALKPSQTRLYFYKTHNGAEIDLLIVNGNQVVATVEIKFASTPNLSKGYYECLSDLKAPKNYVITTGIVKWKMQDDVIICPLVDFLENELVNL